MRYVRLGGTGTELSALCLGTWMFGNDYGDEEAVDRDTSQAILTGAFERGLNFIDTANIYGMPASDHDGPEPGRSESYIGEWLQGIDRESVVIASKVFFTTRGRQPIGLSRKIVRAEIEGRSSDSGPTTSTSTTTTAGIRDPPWRRRCRSSTTSCTRGSCTTLG